MSSCSIPTPRPYAVPASPLLPRIPPERAGHSIPPRVSAERRLLRTSRRIPWESASRQKPSEASGFMADEQRFRRMKYRRFMSSLESTSGVSALACISFFPSWKTSGPLQPPSRRNSRVRAQARTVWRLDLPQSPHTSPAENVFVRDAVWYPEIGVGLRGRARKRQAPSLPTSFVWISFQRVWPFFARRASLSVRSTVEPSWQEYPFMS